MTVSNDWKWICDMCGAREVVASQGQRPSLWKIVKLVYDDTVEGESFTICKVCFGASGAAGVVQRKTVVAWMMSQFRKLKIVRKKAALETRRLR